MVSIPRQTSYRNPVDQAMKRAASANSLRSASSAKKGSNIPLIMAQVGGERGASIVVSSLVHYSKLAISSVALQSYYLFKMIGPRNRWEYQESQTCDPTPHEGEPVCHRSCYPSSAASAPERKQNLVDSQPRSRPNAYASTRDRYLKWPMHNFAPLRTTLRFLTTSVIGYSTRNALSSYPSRSILTMAQVLAKTKSRRCGI